jgi:hypothetical protein
VLADIVAGRNAKLSFEEHHSYKTIEFDFVAKCHRPVAEPSLTTLSLRSNKTLKSFGTCSLGLALRRSSP